MHFDFGQTIEDFLHLMGFMFTTESHNLSFASNRLDTIRDMACRQENRLCTICAQLNHKQRWEKARASLTAAQSLVTVHQRSENTKTPPPYVKPSSFYRSDSPSVVMWDDSLQSRQTLRPNTLFCILTSHFVIAFSMRQNDNVFCSFWLN